MGESGTMRGGPVLFITIASLYAVENGEIALSPKFRTLHLAIAVLHVDWPGDPSGRSPASHLIIPFQRDISRTSSCKTHVGPIRRTFIVRCLLSLNHPFNTRYDVPIILDRGTD